MTSAAKLYKQHHPVTAIAEVATLLSIAANIANENAREQVKHAHDSSRANKATADGTGGNPQERKKKKNGGRFVVFWSQVRRNF